MISARTLASVITVSVLASSLLCGCDTSSGPVKEPDGGGDKPAEIEVPDNEVLAILGYSNGAWGYSASKLFILSDGRVYCSDEEIHPSRPTFYSAGITDEQRLELLEEYTTPVAQISGKDIKKLYGYIVKIDPDAEFEYDDLYACDAGLYYTSVKVDDRMIRISESGDSNGALDDKNAKKADALIDKILTDHRQIVYPNVYTSYEVFLDTLECSKTVASLNNSKRIITNAEELKAFEKETGLKLSGMEEFEYFGNPDYDAFYEFVIAVQIFNCPYVEEPDKAEAFIVSDNYVGFASLEADHDGGVVVDTYEGKVKTCCHIAVLPYYGNDTSSPYDPFIG